MNKITKNRYFGCEPSYKLTLSLKYKMTSNLFHITLGDENLNTSKMKKIKETALLLERQSKLIIYIMPC